MREYKIRNDLERAVIDGFALPLGIAPINLPSPTQGYTLEFHEGEDGDPDTFSSVSYTHLTLPTNREV